MSVSFSEFGWPNLQMIAGDGDGDDDGDDDDDEDDEADHLDDHRHDHRSDNGNDFPLPRPHSHQRRTTGSPVWPANFRLSSFSLN